MYGTRLCHIYLKLITESNSPSDSAHYAHTNLSRNTTELLEIPVFSLADDAITYTWLIALRFGVITSPVLERESCKGVMRKACRVSDTWREI